MLDGNDQTQRLEALVTAQSRTMDGRFRGKSAVYSAPLPMPEFLSLDEASDRINGLIDTFAAQAELYSGQGPAPFSAIAASPGAGKSLLTRRAIARGLFSSLSGNGTYYVPTLALAEEAHLDFTMLGFPSFVWRGRSAQDPDAIQPPDEPRPRMCKRFTLAEQAAAKGFAVYQTLCKKQLPSGRFEKCPHFDMCRYLRQLEGLPAAGAVVIKTHAMIARDTASIDDKPALRVIDESPVSTLTEHLEVPFDEFERELAYTSDAVARAAVDFLLGNVAGQPASILPADFRQAAETLLNLAVPGGTPAMREKQLQQVISRAPDHKAARVTARLLSIVAECLEEGRLLSERLTCGPRSRLDTTRVCRVHDRVTLKDNIPTLLLDADADPLITQQLFNPGPVEKVLLRPQAEVIQVHDHLFSKNSLLEMGVRERVRNIVEAEVLRDRWSHKRGVLVVASQSVVEAFKGDFIAAGNKLNASPDQRPSTSLYGAEWIWFGPSSRGVNAWKDFGTVVVIGREEPGLTSLEDFGRALFGDGAVPLELIGGGDNAKMPEVIVPYLMSNGLGRGALVTQHPDLRCNAILKQIREYGARQAFERVRLARATPPKRLILLSRLPIPDLPVDRLVKLGDIEPPRFIQAIVEAANRSGVLRLTASGLAADAPRTFPTQNAAEKWLARGGRHVVKTPMPVIRKFITGAGGEEPQLTMAQGSGKKARQVPALVLP